MPSPLKSFATACALLSLATPARPAGPAPDLAPLTERRYLSGHGPRDAVPWEFSVTGGRRAGERASIPVPSNWELQGFGTYNYGQGPTPKADEHGLYRVRFSVPDAWKGRRIRLVFEGVMTDATVKLNGRSAGPTHQGAFYRFSYDVTALVTLGAGADNLLEVDVAKVSANPDTEGAERSGDYWVFGGIFRPVWLEATPAQSIGQVAVDARADGGFAAEVTLDSARDATRLDAQIIGADGRAAGAPFSAELPAGGTGRVRLATRVDSPALWTSETPGLYSLKLTLRRGEEALHAVTTRFGFRTFEVRAGDGLYLNGRRILLKGVDRHSFRPETGRALSPEDCYDDVRLIKEMNMNAARMSHYPPDEAFLEACDELGLYVLDELSGWHHAHDTPNGRVLVRAMVERDVNHPSILFWDNGNEGGFNRDLDGDFALYDPQNRRVLHPWELHDGVDTKHYPDFGDLTRRLRGPNVFMPTEFIHAIFDGGAGAGLEDYWRAISSSPYAGGGFIWMFSDEGVVRTDQNGRIDVFGTYDPDGIVGPHHEKEGSFFTIRDLYSPVQIAPPVLDAGFDGALQATNRFDFTPLDRCSFSWKLVRFSDPADLKNEPAILAEGNTAAPAIPPHADGRIELRLPAGWRELGADALLFTASDPDGRKLWTWTWPTPALASRMSGAERTSASGGAAPASSLAGTEIRLTAGPVTASFDSSSGLLLNLRNGERAAALTNGPRLAYGRPQSAGGVEWLPFASEDASTQTRRLAAPHQANTLEIDLDYTRTVAYAAFKLEISADGESWKTLYDGARRAGDGKGYNFPPQPVVAVRLSRIRRSDGQPIAVKSVRLGFAAGRFPAAPAAPGVVTTGEGRDSRTGESIAWVDSRGGAGLDGFRWTLRGDGTLALDFAYTLNGEFLYHGITFDHPEDRMNAVRWLGEGPYRVWQNRLRGTELGVHRIERNDIQPGESWTYPEFQGCFAGLRWAQFDTAAGKLLIRSDSPNTYLRIGTPRISHQNTSVEFPAGDLSFLRAIPAIGSKFIPPERSGPASQPAKAAGVYRGSLVFKFSAPGKD